MGGVNSYLAKPAYGILMRVMEAASPKGQSPQAKAWLTAQRGLGHRAARPAIVWSVGGVSLGIVQALALAILLAGVLEGTGVAWYAAAVFAAAALLRTITGVRGERAARAAGAAARKRLRAAAFAALLHPDWTGRAAGDAIATLQDRIEALDGYFARYLPAVRMAVLGPAIILVATVTSDWRGALILLAAGCLVPVGMALSGIGAGKASAWQFTAMSRLQSRFLDRMRGIGTIVLHGQTDAEARALGTAADELRVRTMRVLRVAFLSSSVLDLAQAAALIALSLRGAALIRAGEGATAPLFALLLVAEFFAPLRAYAAAYQDGFAIRAASGPLSALTASIPAMPAGPVRTIAASGIGIVFDGVTIVRDAARGPVVEDLSFRVGAGETVLLAGPSGAGKSTILDALLGWAPLTHGTVKLNGVPLTDITAEARAALIGIVPQRPALFAGTVEENIRFARADATPAELTAAIRAARLEPVLDALPDGLATRIGADGFGLSGGQAQRIAIARAFLRDAPILLLDEPTAHLDPATEADVLDRLKVLAAGRTTLIAAHSTAAQAFAGRRISLEPVASDTVARGAA